MKKNVILLGVVLVLGILVLVLPSREEKKEEPADKTVQLISIREPELKKITLKINQSQKEIAIEKKVSGGYAILPSGKEAGNSETMDFIAQINTLQGFPLNVKIEEKENFTLTAQLVHQTMTLKVYGVRPFGKPAYYVKTDKGLFVADKEKVDSIFKIEENTLRNHVLTDYTSKDILEFQVDQKKFYQKEEGKWFLQGLKEEETDSNKIFGVFATVSSLRIKNFTGQSNKTLYQLDRPLHTVVIKLKTGKILKYFLSKVKESYYCLPEGEKEILEMNQYDWKYFQQDEKDFKMGSKIENHPENMQMNQQEDQEEEGE